MENLLDQSSLFLQQLVNGITLGGVYALIAVGYTMVYGVIQLINFMIKPLLIFILQVPIILASRLYFALMMVVGFQCFLAEAHEKMKTTRLLALCIFLRI